MQFHIPSVVHAVPTAISVPEPVVPVDAGVPAEVVLLAAGLVDTTGTETGLDADATGADVAEALPVVGTVAKTPPGRVDAEAFPVDFGAEAEAVAGAVVLGAEEAPPVAVATDPPVAPEPAVQPVGAFKSDVVEPARVSTESPGFGKITSFESTVPQESAPTFLMLATNMLGRALKAAVSRWTIWVLFWPVNSSSSSRLEVAAVNVTGAQFMYISRFPILLNQVQASVADPVGSVVGILKEYVLGSTASALLPLFPATP